MIPEAVRLGPFEKFLLSNFVLLGEQIVRLGTRKYLLFHDFGCGYRRAEIFWEGRRRMVLEHRFKFLLHHRWLPRTIDHINRQRGDNRLENLRASTPYLQSTNRRQNGAN